MARAVCQGAKTAKRYAALGAGMEVDAQGYGREPTAMVRGVLSCLFVCLFVPNPPSKPNPHTKSRNHTNHHPPYFTPPFHFHHPFHSIYTPSPSFHISLIHLHSNHYHLHLHTITKLSSLNTIHSHYKSKYLFRYAFWIIYSSLQTSFTSTLPGNLLTHLRAAGGAERPAQRYSLILFGDVHTPTTIPLIVSLDTLFLTFYRFHFANDTFTLTLILIHQHPKVNHIIAAATLPIII